MPLPRLCRPGPHVHYSFKGPEQGLLAWQLVTPPVVSPSLQGMHFDRINSCQCSKIVGHPERQSCRVYGGGPGTLPGAFAKKSTAMNELVIRWCQMEGRLPAHTQLPPNLETLDLFSNRFTGQRGRCCEELRMHQEVKDMLSLWQLWR